VVTEVIPYNEKRVKAAIERELARDGQVYFVHNRISDIKTVADDIQKLAPDAKIVIGHGQMPDDELHNADRFGLADLHQLRGRVGRYKHRAYCYLLLPGDRPVTDIATRRLRAIEEFSMLGAGFKIAMKDLEIRGAGNLLGAEQSGHIAAVGYDMYCKLLDQAARELRQEKRPEIADTAIEIGATGVIPTAYIASENRRLEAYRRIAGAHSAEELAKVEEDLKEAYGEAPRGVARLIELAAVRIGAAAIGVRSIAVHEQDVVFRTERVTDLIAVMEGIQGTVRPLTPKPGDTLAQVYWRPPEQFLEADTLLAVLRRRFGKASTTETQRTQTKSGSSG
jgi:transcription-repair coupling factor (superfamily II helicase)